MNIVIAIDSFKGSLTSLEAGTAASLGIKKAIPEAEIHIRSLADGGEGTVEALVHGMEGRMEYLTVSGPLGKPVSCSYGILEISGTAVLEMASAAGITLVDKQERNPLHTTTYGVGEMIRDGIKKGCRTFIIGIGGSATNDGGIGMLQALGYGIFNKEGKQVSFGAKGLREIHRISEEHVMPELKDCTFKIACDVGNELCGVNGCSAIFGPQKGANKEMVKDMDRWMARYAQIAKGLIPSADAGRAGAGAAGGIGFAFQTFLQGTLMSGVEIVMAETGLEEIISKADMVVTGEGRLDGQTRMGKAPIGVAKLAKKYQKPVIAFSGVAARDAASCNEEGIDAFFPILREITSLEEAMNLENAKQNMTDTAEQVFRLVCLLQRRNK